MSTSKMLTYIKCLKNGSVELIILSFDIMLCDILAFGKLNFDNETYVHIWSNNLRVSLFILKCICYCKLHKQTTSSCSCSHCKAEKWPTGSLPCATERGINFPDCKIWKPFGAITFLKQLRSSQHLGFRWPVRRRQERDLTKWKKATLLGPEHYFGPSLDKTHHTSFNGVIRFIYLFIAGTSEAGIRQHDFDPRGEVWP
jgi:hypothetical protein